MSNQKWAKYALSITVWLLTALCIPIATADEFNEVSDENGRIQELAASVLAEEINTASVPIDGGSLFKQKCQSCHSGIIGSRAPTPQTLAKLSVAGIIHSLTVGTMRSVGATLSGAERRAVAEFISVTKTEIANQLLPQTYCNEVTQRTNSEDQAAWLGWGGSIRNLSYQSAENAGLSVADLSALTLKWAFGFPDSFSAWAQPVVANGRVFVGSQAGSVFSLDAKTGCIFWQFEAKAGVRGAINIGPLLSKGQKEQAAYFGDMAGNVYGVNAMTGSLLWVTALEEHPKGRITGSPVLYENTLFVPMSSWQTVEQAGENCCTFRGSVSAVDVKTGQLRWKTYTIAQKPELTTKRDRLGNQLYGPSGSAIWQALTIDEKRRRIYAGTGNSYTAPAVNSNSMLAFDIDSGEIVWSKQMTVDDIWIAGCEPGDMSCNFPDGENLDLSTAPLLAELPDGSELIVAGQKSGWVYAFDPDNNGALRWSYRAAQGSSAGGIVWGLATDNQKVYIPVSDITAPNPGGLHAIDLSSGQAIWQSPPVTELLCGIARYGCNAAQPVGLTVIPGLIFAGAVDGGFRAYDSHSGKVLWQYDTNQSFATVNEVRANGGSLIGSGPSVVDGMVFVNSGYGTNGGRPGNVLLAFGTDNKQELPVKVDGNIK